MYLVASTNAAVGLDEAMAVLRAGGAAVDAVEIAIRAVEANAEDHSVGYGGYPNLIGEVARAATYAERMFTVADLGPLTPDQVVQAIVEPAEEIALFQKHFGADLGALEQRWSVFLRGLS